MPSMILASSVVLDIGLTGLKLGLIFCIMTLGVHITFRILDIADLSIEGTFPFGACIAATLIYFNVPALVATIIAVVGGGIAGLVTGLLHTKLKIPAILSGIITMTGLYSINLAILGLSAKESITRATLPIENGRTIFAGIAKLLNNVIPDLRVVNMLSVFIVCGIVVAIIFILIYFFFGTELGMTIRSTGDNEQMSRAQGISTSKMKIIGLIISNALIALAGSLFAQQGGVANVTSGRGMIVIALASIIIGEIIFGRKTYKLQLVSMIVGTVIYYILRAIAIEFNVVDFLDLVSAVLIVIIMAVPVIKQGLEAKKKRGEIDARN